MKRGSNRKTSSPPFRGSFIGRDADLQAIETQISSGVRLLTVLGPGGVGKTRLLHHVTARLAERFDRAAFCDLTSARTPGSVVSSVAQAVAGVALGAATTSEEASRRVGRALARRETFLLSADNLEQLDEGSLAPFAEWLGQAPGLVVIATSRVRLGLAGEVVFRVAPLEGETALRLFEDRAFAVRPQLSDDEREVAKKLVTLLDGMPLALEMAATRLAVLSPHELLARLSRPLAVLSSSARGDPERHSSLSRVLEGSWELLGEPERRALGELGVFDGGFTVRAAEGLLEAGVDVLGTLQRLADSSLLRTLPSRAGHARHAPWEVVREYALERLADAGGVDTTRARHAAWFVAFAESSETTLAELVDDETNIAAAAEWAGGDTDDVDRLLLHLRLLAALEPVRMLRGQLEAWSDAIGRALARLPIEVASRAKHVVAKSALARARALHELGRPNAAEEAYERARVAAVEGGDPTRTGFAMCGLGRLVAGMGQWERACSLFASARDLEGASAHVRKLAAACFEFYGTESGVSTDVVGAVASYVALCRETGDSRELVFWLVQLGRAESELGGRSEDAEAHLREGLALARSLGDVRGEGFALFGLGAHATGHGSLDEAIPLLRDAVTILREAGTRRYEAWALGFLGATHALRRELDDAAAVLDAAITLLADVGDAPRESHLRAFRGAVFALRDDDARARMDFARAEELAPAASIYHAWTIDLCKAQLDARPHPDRARALLARAREAPSWFFEPRIAAMLLEQALHGGALRIARDGSFVVLPSGVTVTVPGRGKLQKVLLTLANARANEPGAFVGAQALIESAWPGERIARSAASNRLHVALDHLRRIGLREVLLRGEKGWNFDSAVPFAWTSDSEN